MGLPDGVPRLEPYELKVVQLVARERLETASGPPAFAYRKREDGFRTHLIGAASELVAAKDLGGFWTMGIGVGTNVPDIVVNGLGCEVRWNNGLSMLNNQPALKCRPSDREDRPLVLVTGWPELKVVGWSWPEWVRERGEYVPATASMPACWWLDHKELQPMKNLPRRA